MSTPAEQPGPVRRNERISALDELRGFAVLGILLVNITSMGLPATAWINPNVYGGDEGADRVAWYVTNIFVDGTMRAIFSMLFGAGFVLFLDRLEARGAGSSAAVLMSRRALLLIAFGVFDVLVLLWEGDILWGYGIAAFCLLPFWKARIRVLLVAFGALLIAQMAWVTAVENRLESTYAAYTDAAALEQSGRELSGEQKDALTAWPAAAAFWHSSDEDVAEALEKPTKSWLELSADSSASILGESIGRFVRLVLLDALLGMLVGMIAYRAGLLTGTWAPKRLVALTIACVVVALPLRIASTYTLVDSDFSVFGFLTTRKTYHVERIGLAFFWIGLLLLLLRVRWMSALRAGFAAVGRVALSNYLLQSALAAVFFLGLDYYGLLSRAELYFVVAFAWTICLAFSVLWLRRFSMGPAEWLWRAGTYGGIGGIGALDARRKR